LYFDLEEASQIFVFLERKKKKTILVL